MHSTMRRALVGTAAVALIVPFTACGSESGGSDLGAGFDQEAEVTITVGGKPTSDQPENLAAFEAAVERFEKKYPNITVEGDETAFDTQTFSALLVGGTLPTTMTVPFTEIQGLIARDQVADVTDFVEEDEILAELNPELREVVTGPDDRVYGIVRAAYTMGLIYDRSLYEQAGLDPDSPPTTWQEVLDNAEAIEEKTDATGFVIPTIENYGGWLSTTMSYSNGDLVQQADGEDVSVTLDTEGMRASLETLRQSRWDLDVAGENFLMSPSDINDALAGGSVAQTINGAAGYLELVSRRGMPPENVGIAPLPMVDDAVGALGGGSIQWTNPNATPNEIYASLQWTKFYYLERYTDEEEAIAWAEAQQADGLPVGVPEYPLVSQEQYDQYLEWIEPYVDVDREHFAAYLESLESVPVVPEPAVKAQELYAALDPVVQAVYTREDADVESLLAEVESQIQSQIDLEE